MSRQPTRRLLGIESLSNAFTKTIAKMKDGVRLINTARGALVDEKAMVEALRSGRIVGAALDVFEGAPDPGPRFLDLPNALLQPHHASGTMETRHAMGQLQRDNPTAHFAGQPRPTPVLRGFR